MADGNEIEGMLLDLLAQVHASLPSQEVDALERMIRDGRQRDTLESICRLMKAQNQPLPLPANAVALKLADRLGLDAASLGLLS